LNLQSTAEDVTALDLNLVHPMTGLYGSCPRLRLLA
jgi:hypothetical protein